MNRSLHLILYLLALLFMAGCRAGRPPVTPPPTSLLPATPLPTPTLPPLDSGWQTLEPGLEQRTLNVVDEQRLWQESVTVLRLDPAYFRFDVHYRPGEPLQLEAWQMETGALLVVNGGFYTEGYFATGLVISGTSPLGNSYAGFGGMFAVTAAGPEVRSLAARPYDPAEPLQAALQSFPLLVRPGGELGFPEEDGQQARRTVVAQDRAGRILFLVANRGTFTLHGLSRYLVESDLELDVALNLDGGPSSGLLLAGQGDEPRIHLPAFALLPVVIAAYPR